MSGIFVTRGPQFYNPHTPVHWDQSDMIYSYIRNIKKFIHNLVLKFWHALMLKLFYHSMMIFGNVIFFKVYSCKYDFLSYDELYTHALSKLFLPHLSAYPNCFSISSSNSLITPSKNLNLPQTSLLQTFFHLYIHLLKNPLYLSVVSKPIFLFSYLIAFPVLARQHQ